MRNMERIEEIKYDANAAKERLVRIAEELEAIGAIREAKSLMTIVYKLEIWQNK